MILRRLKWFAINIILYFSVYMALCEGNQNWENVARFLLWTIIIISLATLNDQVRKIIKEGGKTFPVMVSMAFDSVILLIIVYYGWIITGIFWFIQIAMLPYIYKKD